MTADPFAALADESRRAIVTTLASGERSVGELAAELPISRPAVSRHLRLLKEAGLVVVRPAGTRRLYRLDERGAEEVRRFMAEVWGAATTRFKIYVENTRG